jgi:hypothetical protein
VPKLILGRVTTAAIALVALVGLADALAGGARDLAATFALVLVLAGAQASTVWSRHRSVPIRADLVRWMSSRALAGEETLGAVADRAVSAYRAGFVDDAAERTAHRVGHGDR